MILNLILWYLVIALAGWLVFPLAYRLLAFLPDRGLALSRPLGLLLWGYAYWLLVSLDVLQNDAGGAVFALLLVAGYLCWQCCWTKTGSGGETARLAARAARAGAGHRAALPGVVCLHGRWCARRTRMLRAPKNRWSWPSSIPSCARRLSRPATRGCRVMPFRITTLAT